MNLMFVSSSDEPPEDIQELINSTSHSPNCKPSTTAPEHMESGRGGTGGSVPSRSPKSDQLMRVHREGKKEPGRGPGGFWGMCFSLPFLLLLGVTASLVILPLVLPPLPPPPSMLMLVPVAMLLVLLALAFMPTSAGRGAMNPTYL